MEWFDKLPDGLQAILVVYYIVFWAIIGLAPIFIIGVLISYLTNKKKEK